MFVCAHPLGAGESCKIKGGCKGQLRLMEFLSDRNNKIELESCHWRPNVDQVSGKNKAIETSYQRAAQ